MLFSIRATKASITAGSSSAPSSFRASIAASSSSRWTDGSAMVRLCQWDVSHRRPRWCSSLRMPRRNRVTPRSELIAYPARGQVYGNRGCLHDEQGRIRRRWATRRWIACRLEFRGWHREPLMQPGKFTELFFLDEATAFAAGHRPCALCRREDYRRFGEIWAELHPGQAGADAIDSQLHKERLAGPREMQLAALTDGAFVLEDGK